MVDIKNHHHHHHHQQQQQQQDDDDDNNNNNNNNNLDAVSFLRMTNRKQMNISEGVRMKE